MYFRYAAIQQDTMCFCSNADESLRTLVAVCSDPAIVSVDVYETSSLRTGNPVLLVNCEHQVKLFKF